MFAFVLLGTLLDFCSNFCLSKIQSKFLVPTIFYFRGFLYWVVQYTTQPTKGYQKPFLWCFSECFTYSLSIHTSFLQ